MARVLVQWSVAPVAVPSNTDLSQYMVRIDGVGALLIPFGQLEAEFDPVAPGDYTARVALTNGDGSRIEFEKTADFNVPEEQAFLDAPDVVTVSVF